MQYHVFENGIKLPLVGLGTFPLRGVVLATTVKKAIDFGYELFDTAVSYKNEQEIGAMIKDGVFGTDYSRVFITSKVDVDFLKGRKRYLYLNGKSIKKSYRISCGNLNLSKLGAYLLHMPFDGCSKYYKDLMKLYDDGKVDVIGVSNFDVRELKELHEKCGRWPMMNQTEISPYNTQCELIQFCKDNGILVQAYSPFGRGNLVKELMNDQVLLDIAKSHDKTVGQIVLRFIVQQEVAVVARSTDQERLRQNIDVFDFSLTEGEMNSISKLNKNVVFGRNQVNKYNSKMVKI